LELSLVPVAFLVLILIHRIKQRRSRLEDLMPMMADVQQPSDSEPYDMKHAVHSLTSEDFELLVALIYQRQGYRVSMSSAAGCDFTIARKAERVLVQCKKLSQDHKVPVERVRELHEAMTTAGTTRGMYVAPCGFSWDAKNFAKSRGVTLINARTLDELLLAAREMPEEDLLAVANWAPKLMGKVQLTPPLCPACEATMEELSTSNGSAWVCTERPECRGRRSARKHHKPVRAAAKTTDAPAAEAAPESAAPTAPAKPAAAAPARPEPAQAPARPAAAAAKPAAPLPNAAAKPASATPPRSQPAQAPARPATAAARPAAALPNTSAKPASAAPARPLPTQTPTRPATAAAKPATPLPIAAAKPASAAPARPLPAPAPTRPTTTAARVPGTPARPAGNAPANPLPPVSSVRPGTGAARSAVPSPKAPAKPAGAAPANPAPPTNAARPGNAAPKPAARTIVPVKK
jgi:ssDNA-binding Zn-finger/Zn-ribbon topoisomerase 1